MKCEDKAGAHALNNPGTQEFDFPSCIELCKAKVRTEGGANAEAAIALYRKYPVPTAAEWAEVIDETDGHPDVGNPFGLIACYEKRVAARGFEIVSDTMGGELLARFYQTSAALMVPPELAPWFLASFLVQHDEVLSKTNSIALPELLLVLRRVALQRGGVSRPSSKPGRKKARRVSGIRRK